jgi:hypothetical protein
VSVRRKRKEIPALVQTAPLPEPHGGGLTSPTLQRLVEEMARAEVELIHALGKHRDAWDWMSRLKEEARQQGNAFFMDNDRRWKLAVGDVQWWRGEVNARSNSVLALAALIDRR